MNKIAVIGKPGGGKSTLGKSISSATGIMLYALDSIEFKQNGERVDAKIFSDTHQSILSSDSWIIEGFGSIESFYTRIEAADTLIYIDMPYLVHYLWVTKRWIKGLFKTPDG